MQNIPTYMNNLFSANITVARVVAILRLPLAPCITRSNSYSKSECSPAHAAINIASCTTPNRSIRSPFALQLQRGGIAVVSGRVGCGKSTLLQIIAGECDISASSSSIVSGRTLFVPQEPQLFKGSIRDNICLGRPCDEARLNRAIYDACLTEDLSALDDGLQSDVGSRGSSLSGGQRARVSISRVLYHVEENDILVLDDVFAALDEQTFKQVVQRIFVATSIPESVTVILTCARGLNCSRTLRSICICDGAVTLQPSPLSIFDGSTMDGNSLSPRLSSSKVPSSSWPVVQDNSLKTLLEELERDSQLPEHTMPRSLISSTAAQATGHIIQDSENLTQLVDWSNLAV